MRTEARVEVTEAVREWDYGDYEGLTSKKIKADRAERGEEPWDIWNQGCPGGEYVFLFLLFGWHDIAMYTAPVCDGWNADPVAPIDPPKMSPADSTT